MDYSQMTASGLFGLSPGGMSPASAGGGGDVLPPVSHMAGDRGVVPWHPDSPSFWLIAVGTLTLVGVLGASFNLRAGPARAGASVGKV